MSSPQSVSPRLLSIGYSVEERPIVLQFVGAREGRGAWEMPRRLDALLIGGLHGDEPATIRILERYIDRLRLCAFETAVGIISVANPDGYERGTRYNARGVDLNRNCDSQWSEQSQEPPGPHPWSEPESRALRDCILRWQPRRIVSLHWALSEIDPDGPQSDELAQAMWDAMSPRQRAPYRLLSGAQLDIGAASFCPGSFGQWCGYELTDAEGERPAMITLELPWDPHATSREEPLPEEHLQFVHEAWRRDPDAYLDAVAGGVIAMLDAACQPQ